MSHHIKWCATAQVASSDGSVTLGGLTAIDHIEGSIAELRGSAAAWPRPTWPSSIHRRGARFGERRTTRRGIWSRRTRVFAEVNTIWGVSVLVTTQLSAGTGVLMDTTKFGAGPVEKAYRTPNRLCRTRFHAEHRSVHRGGADRAGCPETIGRPRNHRPADLMNVTILAPFRVVHDGTAYRPG